MKFRVLDSDGDWSFGAGRNNYASANIAIGLNIKTRLKMWVDDCFFDMTAGIDWYARLGSKNQRALLENDIKRIILQSEGVTGILSFETFLNGRNFTADYSVATIYTPSFEDSLTVGI